MDEIAFVQMVATYTMMMRSIITKALSGQQKSAHTQWQQTLPVHWMSGQRSPHWYTYSDFPAIFHFRSILSDSLADDAGADEARGRSPPNRTELWLIRFSISESKKLRFHIASEEKINRNFPMDARCLLQDFSALPLSSSAIFYLEKWSLMKWSFPLFAWGLKLFHELLVFLFNFPQ